jgi:hypothetical protein
MRDRKSQLGLVLANPSGYSFLLLRLKLHTFRLLTSDLRDYLGGVAPDIDSREDLGDEGISSGRKAFCESHK